MGRGGTGRDAYGEKRGQRAWYLTKRLEAIGADCAAWFRFGLSLSLLLSLLLLQQLLLLLRLLVLLTLLSLSCRMDSFCGI